MNTRGRGEPMHHKAITISKGDPYLSSSNVAFKLSIFNFEKVEILFKLLNMVVDVAFKLYYYQCSVLKRLRYYSNY